MRSLTVFWVLLVAVYAKHSYEGHKVYRIHPSNEAQLEVLSKLNKNHHFDFLSPLTLNRKHVDVMVDAQGQAILSWILHTNRIKYEITVEDVEIVVQQDRLRQLLTPPARTGKISFDRYYRFDEINAYLDQLQVDHSNLVTVQSIGSSYENQDLKIIQISTDRNAGKPIIFIDAGIHAREWIAPALALYIINQLVENQSNRYLLDKVDWHILPVMNPDGYEYSHTDKRMWRKTRSPQPPCDGTDGNRNFEFHWGEIGASSYPCDDDFMGPRPFSEIETSNVRDYLLSHMESTKLYLTLHCCGNYLLYPWGFTSDLPHDDAELRYLAENVNSAIVAAGGDEYEIGTSTNVLYAAAGGSDDWAKAIAGIQLSYTVELPGGGMLGFDVPPGEINGHVTQTFAGIKVYGDYIATKFGS